MGVHSRLCMPVNVCVCSAPCVCRLAFAPLIALWCGGSCRPRGQTSQKATVWATEQPKSNCTAARKSAFACVILTSEKCSFQNTGIVTKSDVAGFLRSFGTNWACLMAWNNKDGIVLSVKSLDGGHRNITSNTFVFSCQIKARNQTFGEMPGQKVDSNFALNFEK